MLKAATAYDIRRSDTWAISPSSSPSFDHVSLCDIFDNFKSPQLPQTIIENTFEQILLTSPAQLEDEVQQGHLLRPAGAR
jgi:hypothetical protein